MIRLRNLETRDALPMLEWMDDFDTTRYLQKDFQKYTLDDCLRFIEDSNRNTDSVHLCIDEDGVYCGTVSLKNLIVGKSAEFAIVMHPAARGKGIGSYALDIILNYGFNEKNLGLIYWSVRKDNIRAIRLYDKKGYGRSTCEMIEIKLGGGIPDYTKEQKASLMWYLVTRKERAV